MTADEAIPGAPSPQKREAPRDELRDTGSDSQNHGWPGVLTGAKAPREPALALDVEGWITMLLGCEDADGPCMCVPGAGVESAAALEVHISFPSRDDGGQSRPGL